jgi:DNA-binding beta-propeller fold protein YncE
MPLPVPTTIATGFSDAVGSDYRQLTDQLYIADAGANNIVTVTGHTHVKTIVGTGYNEPSDIELSGDGLHAYVTENPGTLLRLSLTNLNRAAATVVASGFNGIDQVALDEAHGFAYVCEFTAGQIQRVTLATGVKKVVASIASPRGVLVTSDGLFIYVSSDAGTITRFNFATSTSTIIATGLNGPRHLTFADAGESVILFPQPNPTGTVLKADLTTTPATVTAIAGPTAFAPYSVNVLSPNQILITSATTIAEVDLAASLISAAGPILLGIGFVPNSITYLPNGFADTTSDPTYFFQVKDAPFGGTLPLMINWQSARALGANFYQVFINGVMVTSPFADYLWSVPLNLFELQTTVPVGGYYPLRSAGQIWLNNWLGLLLDTTGQPNALNNISVKLFSAQSAASEIGHSTDPGRFANLMIDNTLPTAIIEQIFQQPGNVPINTCGIVTTGAPTFTFEVTASAPAHLLAWSLTAYWGDNQSKAVSSDVYANHITPSRIWVGITAVQVPPPGPTPWNATVTGDPTSTHCAHTFFLYAWDRVINGWGYIHGPASYSKSITIML